MRRILTSVTAALGVAAATLLAGGTAPSAAATANFTSTTLSHSASLVTAHGGLLYVSSESANIWVYNTSNIAAGPLRTISGVRTGLMWARQVAVDATNQELFVADSSGKVLVFPLDAAGNAQPLRQISGDRTQLTTPTGIALHEDTVLVTTIGGSLLTFPRAASGDVEPMRVVRGESTGLSEPYSPTVDPKREEVILANYTGNSVTAYPLAASGNVTPAWTLNTGDVSGPDGLSIDFNRGALLVSLCDAESLAVYSLDARGSSAPVQTVPASNCLYGSSFDQMANRLYVAGYGETFVKTLDFTSQPTWHPTNVRGALSGRGSVKVSWNRPAVPSWTDVNGYVVTASPGGRSCRVGAGATSCVVTGLANGTYRFTVTATNTGGGSAAANPSEQVTVAGTPGRASVKGSQCVRGVPVVTFGAPTSTGGARITAYDYRYRVGASGSIKSGSSATATGRLPALKTGFYEVSVAARNAAGLRGEFSAFAKVPACK